MKQLQIGYGRVNITPDYPVAMAGGASTRISEGYLDPLYITFIAIRQNTETFLVATMDFVGSYEEFSEPARKNLSQATGIPEDHIILNSTHTHSSVSIRYETGEGIARYRKAFHPLGQRCLGGAGRTLRSHRAPLLQISPRLKAS